MLPKQLFAIGNCIAAIFTKVKQLLLASLYKASKKLRNSFWLRDIVAFEYKNSIELQPLILAPVYNRSTSADVL